ncbi:MAG: glycerophosphoryl diester phosphodiesterase [Rhodospirillales bacterium]|jgi:glycerophosphoryl diester phosphodiesterase|nr:glycerophosphoryl diester phosphodiesterase [Rhodospirillales bacterium]MBT4041464.1 glycerophosphoryl diester phosphodiesterase [Rhodospirillales bacterium]MBT4625147.1 glycerophosphoryl diester phosphodiesterase [Rhodospirillales bacterium]MBT5353287.1 glycerophosphoryl diester phosphodiesterase [Rhodospirillales bacterium]MBT5519831.1 glycerophosphoryl diester phosphodiesterase [Rhodospirillales bacterium]
MTTTLSSKGRILPKIIGHRGACGHAPENTLASFRKACDLGVEWVEFDTKLTKDGHVVVFHDDTLDRTTNGEGNIRDTTLADLQDLDAGSWFHEDFAGETVPTLKNALTVLAELGLSANVEIKPSEGQEMETAEAVCEVINNHWPVGMPLPVLSSFKDDCLAVARDRLPQIERASLLLEDFTNWQSRAEAAGSSAVHVWHEPLTESLFREFTGAGYPVRVYTVNEVDLASKLFGWGVESVCTNYPDRLQNIQGAL